MACDGVQIGWSWQEAAVSLPQFLALQEDGQPQYQPGFGLLYYGCQKNLNRWHDNTV
jgi:hypothetical protein